MIKQERKNGICVVNFPVTKKGVKPVYQLLEVLKKSRKNIYLISGNLSENFYEKSFCSIPYVKITHEIQKSLFGRLKSFLKTQIMISLAIHKFKNNVDIYLFFIGGEGLLLPHIIAKIYRRSFFHKFKKFVIVLKTNREMKIKNKISLQLKSILFSIARKIPLFKWLNKK